MVLGLLRLLTAIPALLRIIIFAAIIWGLAAVAMGATLSATGPMPEMWPIVREVISAL